MDWSKDLPTEAGYYWAESKAPEGFELVKVENHNGLLFMSMFGIDGDYDICHVGHGIRFCPANPERPPRPPKQEPAAQAVEGNG